MIHYAGHWRVGTTILSRAVPIGISCEAEVPNVDQEDWDKEETAPTDIIDI